MALKPLPKIVLIAIGVAALGYAGNYGLTKYRQSQPTSEVASSSSGFGSSQKADPEPQKSAPFVQTDKLSERPLKVSLVSFHGYAPALVANGNSLTTQPGSAYHKLGLNVQFVINDDAPPLATLFEAGTASCAWRTSDFWAQEHPNLRNAKHDGKAVMVVDNTQGGDAIIARDGSIKSVEDLVGKSVALLQFTPSHGMFIDAIQNSSLSAKKKQSIKMVFINADEGTGGVRAAFESGKVDAAVLWDPDLSLAVKNGNGHVVYSTKQATNLIFDIMVCDTKLLNTGAGRDQVQRFVTGWMEGVKAARSNPDNAVQALVKTEKMFEVLAKQEGTGFVKSLFDNVIWTGLEDNARILGLTSGGTNHYERVYSQFDAIYREAGALANPQSPVIPAQNSFDYSFIKSLLEKDVQAVQAATAQAPTFSDQGLNTAAKQGTSLTKPVFVKFTSGSSELTKAAQAVIDKEMVPFLENNGSAYIDVSGNTDSVGSASANRALSLSRSQVVVDYLVKQWDMDRKRFKTSGNGSDKPICNESNPTADGMTLEECRATNRTTRLGLLAR
jgi:NitT/TauT family transport system substrate-binding protein